MRLLNRHFNQCIAGHKELFLWHLHQLKWKLMILIMRLRSSHSQTSQDDKDAYYFKVARNPVLEVMLLDNNEPTSYGEAMVGLDSDKWLEAIKSEIGSMYENKVQNLEELLDGRKAVGCRWILKGRRTMMVNVTIKKARLVVKMFSDKFKELTTMRLFSLVAMLRVCWNYISNYCIIYEILQIGCQNIVSSTIFLRKGCM